MFHVQVTANYAINHYNTMQDLLFDIKKSSNSKLIKLGPSTMCYADLNLLLY